MLDGYHTEKTLGSRNIWGQDIWGQSKNFRHTGVPDVGVTICLPAEAPILTEKYLL